MKAMGSNSEELNLSGDVISTAPASSKISGRMNNSVSRKPSLMIPKEASGGGEMNDDTSPLKWQGPESGTLKEPGWEHHDLDGRVEMWKIISSIPLPLGWDMAKRPPRRAPTHVRTSTPRTSKVLCFPVSQAQRLRLLLCRTPLPRLRPRAWSPKAHLGF